MAEDISKIYGSMVFNDKVMHDRLPKPVYKSLHETIQNGTALDEDSANAVAHAMKEWAIENGCTHYTHWFIVPERWPAWHRRGAWLYCLGSDELRVHQGRGAVHPHGVHLLHG